MRTREECIQNVQGEKFLCWCDDVKANDVEMVNNTKEIKMKGTIDENVKDIKEMNIFLKSFLTEMGVKFMLMFGLPVLFFMSIIIALLLVVIKLSM